MSFTGRAKLSLKQMLALTAILCVASAASPVVPILVLTVMVAFYGVDAYQELKFRGSRLPLAADIALGGLGLTAGGALVLFLFV